MKILFVRRGGRTHRRRSGGIIRSGDMITNALEGLGSRVLSHSDATPVPEIPPDTDLLWVYGGDKHLKEAVDQARAADIPILLNSTYDGTRERAAHIMHQLDEWDPDQRKDIFMGVFTPEAEFAPEFAGRHDQIVAIPKTIRGYTGKTKSFGARSGICVGELGKTFRARLHGNLNVKRIIETLLAEGYPVSAYKQYGTEAEIPEGLHVEPNEKDEDKFFEFLGGFRLYILLTPHCTFEMVPIEAQSCGTVVLYPYMRQSLAQYIGHTGVMYRNEEELLEMVRAIYDNEDHWSAGSRSGVLNAGAHQISLQGPALLRALQGVIRRYRNSTGERP